MKIHTAITGTYCETPCKYRESIKVRGEVVQVCGHTSRILDISKQPNYGKPRETIDTPTGKRIIAGNGNYCDYGGAKKPN